MNVILLARDLLRCPSVTPAEGGALALLENVLKTAGFEVHRPTFSEEGTAPAAIINEQANAVVIAGAVLAGIPLIHRLSPDPVRAIRTGDWVLVNAEDGLVIAYEGAP